MLHVHGPSLHPRLPGVPEILASSCVGCNGQEQNLWARDRKEQREAAAFLPPGRNQPISFSRVLPSYHSNQQLQSISADQGFSEPRRCQGEDSGLVRVKSQILGGKGDPGMGKWVVQITGFESQIGPWRRLGRSLLILSPTSSPLHPTSLSIKLPP